MDFYLNQIELISFQFDLNLIFIFNFEVAHHFDSAVQLLQAFGSISAICDVANGAAGKAQLCDAAPAVSAILSQFFEIRFLVTLRALEEFTHQHALAHRQLTPFAADAIEAFFHKVPLEDGEDD